MNFASERLAHAWIALVVTTGVAAATPADDAFQRGRDLFKDGKFAEACVAFEDSQRLDPSFGTQFNLAQCREKTGRLATALTIYKDLARNDTNPTRKAAAAELATQLATRVPRLQLKLSPPAPGATVTLDGKPCPACLPGPVPVDLGTHALVIHAAGHQDATKTATVSRDGETVAVPITLLPSPSSAQPLPDTPTGVADVTDVADEAPARSSRKRYAVISWIGGGAVVATGAVFGMLARSTWADARAICAGTTCPTDDDTARATALGDRARTRANVSTALFVIGGAAVAAGAVLWITSPKDHGVAVSAAASSEAATLTLSGRF